MWNRILVHELKAKLKEAVQRNSGGALLFSGGLDSSIIGALSATSRAFIVTLQPYGEDLDYAEKVANSLGLELHHKVITVEEALDSIPTTIRILKSFDLAIPNDIAVYFGLKLARDSGAKSVMTGDGADELFAGYSYMYELDLKDYIQRIAHMMHFSSNDLGKHLGLEIKQPYLDKEFTQFAANIAPNLKVKSEEGKIWGKWILRKAFEGLLPEEIIWQDKRPLELGSGTTRLRDIISSKISEEEFIEKKRLYPVNLINKEHLFYYEIYRDVVGPIPKPEAGQVACSECGAGLTKESHHCRTCGATL